ncbi:hypothetical protein [Phormidium yuhuli]|nr:hypothetical protein [Phormidium yuhuli]
MMQTEKMSREIRLPISHLQSELGGQYLLELEDFVGGYGRGIS